MVEHRTSGSRRIAHVLPHLGLVIGLGCPILWVVFPQWLARHGLGPLAPLNAAILWLTPVLAALMAGPLAMVIDDDGLCVWHVGRRQRYRWEELIAVSEEDPRRPLLVTARGLLTLPRAHWVGSAGFRRAVVEELGARPVEPGHWQGLPTALLRSIGRTPELSIPTAWRQPRRLERVPQVALSLISGGIVAAALIPLGMNSLAMGLILLILVGVPADGATKERRRRQRLREEGLAGRLPPTTIRLTPAGLVLELTGQSPLEIPWAAVRGVVADGPQAWIVSTAQGDFWMHRVWRHAPEAAVLLSLADRWRPGDEAG